VGSNPIRRVSCRATSTLLGHKASSTLEFELGYRAEGCSGSARPALASMTFALTGLPCGCAWPPLVSGAGACRGEGQGWDCLRFGRPQ